MLSRRCAAAGPFRATVAAGACGFVRSPKPIGFPLKAVGDYGGRRCVAVTRIYSKIDIEGLREVAPGVGKVGL
jgi:hypothetical protein